MSKNRNGAKITKKYDAEKTPLQRVLDDPGNVRKTLKTRLARENEPLNPVAIRRQIQAITAELLALTASKKAPTLRPSARAS